MGGHKDWMDDMKITGITLVVAFALCGCTQAPPDVVVTSAAPERTITHTPTPTVEPTIEPTVEAPAFVPNEEGFYRAWDKVWPGDQTFMKESAIDTGWNICTLIEQEHAGIWTHEEVLKLAHTNPRKAEVLVNAATKYLCPEV